MAKLSNCEILQKKKIFQNNEKGNEVQVDKYNLLYGSTLMTANVQLIARGISLMPARGFFQL